MEGRTTLPSASTRSYDNTRRQQQATATRERIVTAGTKLVHRSSVRDWGGLTFRAVAELAGVNERTVYRHFENERGLRDAVMHRIEEEAGIDLTAMRLDDIVDVAARIADQVATFQRSTRRRNLDPTLSDADRRQREALRRAVTATAGDWSAADQETAAAVFDVLWNVSALERLAGTWQMDREQAIQAVTWAIGLVERAVRNGERPSGVAS